jgi:GDP-4-dehydro-6-deoxy-D-mannose reductase
MERVLVTGCNGFVGGALVGRLASAGFAVWGADRVAPADGFAGESCLVGDLTDVAFVDRVIETVNPGHVVHLAAQSSVRRSFDEPVGTLRDNTLPTLHILERLRDAGSRARVLLVGSAEEYGSVSPGQLPLPESAPSNPESPYALAKAVQNQYGRMYARLYGVDTVMTRSFNHTGPGQRDVFVLPSFARQVAEIRRGRRAPVIDVGNVEVRRDFLDVRDVCDAYVVLLMRGRSGETYNVCSGQSYRVRDLLDRLCALAGVTVKIHVDASRLRPVDMPELRGDPGKMREHTGWTAKHPIDETLQSLLDYWDGVAGAAV